MPLLILLQNEYGWRERSLLVAAKENGIPTLAIQHGIIIPTHKGYMYTKEEISPNPSQYSLHCPIPDFTAVFGESYLDLLTKVSSYPSNRVIVTGPPRYDSTYQREQKSTVNRISKRNTVYLRIINSYSGQHSAIVRATEKMKRTLKQFYKP